MQMCAVIALAKHFHEVHVPGRLDLKKQCSCEKLNITSIKSALIFSSCTAWRYLRILFTPFE
jgi:hypothetical protein